MPPLRHWLEFGIFLANCRFASLDRFRAELGRLPLDDEFDDGASAARFVRVFTADLVQEPNTASEVTAASALSWCIGSDLFLIADAIDSAVEPDLAAVIDVGLAETAARERYRAVGVELPPASVFVVHDFPRPYQDQDWNAMAPDVEDEEKYGIEPGIYIKASRVTPVFTHVLLAHELVHLIPASVDPAHFPMGLEEGIADVLSSGFFASHSLGVTPAVRHLIHLRFGRPQPDLRSLYADALQRASYLYRLVGLRGIAQLLHRGRQAIHDTERRLIAGQIDSLGLDAGGWDLQTTTVLDAALEAFPRHGIVSPLAMWMLQYVDTGKTLTEISEASRVSESVVTAELEKVACSPRLVLLDDTSVNLSNVQFYLETDRVSAVPTIRYDCE
jgi:hypothetical protein